MATFVVIRFQKDEPLKGMTMNESHVALPKRPHWR